MEIIRKEKSEQNPYIQVKHTKRDCTKCEHYLPVTKGLFECARNFPKECLEQG